MIRKNITLLMMLLVIVMTMHVHADEARTLQIDGIERSYRLRLSPAGTMSPHPLLLLFHGGGGRAKGMVKLTGIEPLADREGFILAFPDGVRRHWHDGRISKKNASKVDDVGFVTALLDELERDYPIDHRRIAAAGMSNGAIFSEWLGCDLTARFTAIIAVAGTLAADYEPHCHPSRPISVLLFSGDADPLVPYNGGKIADSDAGTMLSVADTVAFWSHVDGCTGAQNVRELPRLVQQDPTSVTLHQQQQLPRWQFCHSVFHRTGRPYLAWWFAVSAALPDRSHHPPNRCQHDPATLYPRSSTVR